MSYEEFLKPRAAAKNWPPRTAQTGGPRLASKAASSLQSARAFFLVLGALSALGGLIAGIALMAHTTPQCVANPYNSAFGTDLADCTRRHSLVGTGIAVAVSSLIETAVFLVLAHMCTVVDQQRQQLAAVLASKPSSGE